MTQPGERVIEITALLRTVDVYKINKDAVKTGLCNMCGFFIGNGGLGGIECNGYFAKSKMDTTMVVPHESLVAFREIVQEALCEP